MLNPMDFKGTQSDLGPRWPEIKVHLGFRFNIRSVFLDFQTVIEKPVFECAFALPKMLIFSYLVKNSMDRVSLICKQGIIWYLMRMCASWLCPFNNRKNVVLDFSHPSVISAKTLKPKLHQEWWIRGFEKRSLSLQKAKSISEFYH